MTARVNEQTNNIFHGPTNDTSAVALRAIIRNFYAALV